MGTLSLSNFQDVKIQAPWGHISGRWYGNRTERPILAIHGWLDNLGTFDRLIPQLPDYISVLCIDLPGHGRSSHIQPGMYYSVYDYVYIIPRVMKEYGWTKVSLMGHSLGGVMSFIYTSLAPHTVDMVISLDILLPIPPSLPSIELDQMAQKMEKHLVEEDRQGERNLHEPPSYSFAKLCEILAKGSSDSLTPKLAKHLLHRQVTKSQLYSDRFFFSRDGRVKFYNINYLDFGLAEEMARRIKRKPYLIIKGSKSNKLPLDLCKETMSILAKNNPCYKFYEVQGTHHVHLHAAEECARYIVPFIRHHRPPVLTSWSVPGRDVELSLTEKRRKQEKYLERSRNNLSKL